MPKEVILIAAVTIDGYIARHSFEVTSWSKDLKLFKKMRLKGGRITLHWKEGTASSQQYSAEEYQNFILKEKQT